jgi:hypothetical protein
MKCSTMRFWAYSMLAMLLPSMVFGQQNKACFPVWQGFSQIWGYNHRINRLGDWVENVSEGDSCKLLSSHAAASGSGADRADFTQYYAAIQSDLLQTQSGIATFNLSGKEGDYIAEVQTADVSFLEANELGTHYEVLLNGFDLCTANGAKADKIQALDIAIDSVWRDLPARKVYFRMRVALQFACSSAECESLNQVVDYRLKLYWLALGGQGFVSDRSTFGSGRAWEKQDTAPTPPMARVALLGEARFPKATAGITGLHIQLDDEHHMLTWESRLQAAQYDKGLLMVYLRMAFVQNHPSMYAAFKARYSGHPRPPAHWAVKRKPGSLAWEMDVALLQFEDAEITPHSRNGSVDWKTKHGAQMDAANEAAENVVEIVR